MGPAATGRPRRRDEAGQVALLIIGLASIALLTIAVVIDASAGYLQRQGLDTVADGAALQGADLGAVGAYQDGIPADRLRQVSGSAHDAVEQYLREVGAYRRYPGLKHSVQVDTTAGLVRVTVVAPLDLPLAIPGMTRPPMIAATGSAAVTVQRGPPQIAPDPGLDPSQ